MLDRDGFRPNVGIILLNQKSQVFWGKRIRTHSWQFPQGGIDRGENPEQAMFRELHEEVGLMPQHVQVLARTRDWLRYEVPDRFIRRDARGHYKGQKQIWFLLQLVGHDWDLNLRATDHPEFDAWRWNDYWVPLDVVVEFKRGVYEMALTELARFVPHLDWHGDARLDNHGHHNRHERGHAHSADQGHYSRSGVALELPPGASFEPDPQTHFNSQPVGEEEKMNIRNALVQSVMLSILLLASPGQAQQVYANDAEWKETEAPPPPAFDANKLVIFDVPTSQSLVYGIDPAAVSISNSDSLLRYVVVATSSSGARNVLYEALRCSTGEFKTYARYSSDGKWSSISNPQWRSVFDNMPSKHALRLARAGACDGVATVGSVTELVNKLKNPSRYLDQ